MTDFAVPPARFGPHNPFSMGNGASAPTSQAGPSNLPLSKSLPNGNTSGSPSKKGKEREAPTLTGRLMELLREPFKWVDFVDPEREVPEDEEQEQADDASSTNGKVKKRKRQDDSEAGVSAIHSSLRILMVLEADVPASRQQPSRPTYSYDGIGPRLPSRNDHQESAFASSSSSKDILYPQDPRLTRPTDLTNNKEIAQGFHNLGNTCYQNSVMQVLMHTPPVMEFLDTHRRSNVCPGFCLACNMRDTLRGVWGGGRAYSMREMNSNIKKVCPTMRTGRQEDAHEFLRYAIDGLQDADLRGHGRTKASPAVKETTLIHKSFGGKLRSRVHCNKCGHDSDTFDTFMDLSVDIGGGIDRLQDSLTRIAQTDRLYGKNKYKCEKCKQLVEAEKTLRIVKLPPILSIHLKRFTHTGRKITGAVHYDEQLKIPSKAVDGVSGTYELYGVVCHLGSGVHLGHYYSLIKSGRRKWIEINDDERSLTRGNSGNDRNAYILHYVLNRNKLDAAVNGLSSSNAKPALSARTSNGTPQRSRDIGSPVRPPIPSPSQPVAGPSRLPRPAEEGNELHGIPERPVTEYDRELDDHGDDGYNRKGNPMDGQSPKKPKYNPIAASNFYGKNSAPGANGSQYQPNQGFQDGQQSPSGFIDNRNRNGGGRGQGKGNQMPYAPGRNGGRPNGGHNGGKGKHRQKAKDRMQRR